MKQIVRDYLPPIILRNLSKLCKSENIGMTFPYQESPHDQQLEMYWDSEFADILEGWGADNAWKEIQLLLATAKGKVLDIACGTGVVIKLLDKFENLTVYGCDVSDLLIGRALEKGIPEVRLQVIDATSTNYADNEFSYSYSIGSLEHFTEEGIDKFITESARYTQKCSFHMIPVSRSGENEGWIKTKQSFFNNSEEWWMEKYTKGYQKVIPVVSKWEDRISVGKWFICYK